MNIDWKYKFVIGLSIVFCLSYYLDSKSKTDLQTSLSKLQNGSTDIVTGYNPAPFVAVIGLIIVTIWILLPWIKTWVETYSEFWDNNSNPGIDE